MSLISSTLGSPIPGRLGDSIPASSFTGKLENQIMDGTRRAQRHLVQVQVPPVRTHVK